MFRFSVPSSSRNSNIAPGRLSRSKDFLYQKISPPTFFLGEEFGFNRFSKVSVGAHLGCRDVSRCRERGGFREVRYYGSPEFQTVPRGLPHLKGFPGTRPAFSSSSTGDKIPNPPSSVPGGSRRHRRKLILGCPKIQGMTSCTLVKL